MRAIFRQAMGLVIAGTCAIAACAPLPASAAEMAGLAQSASSAILMDATTGTVIMEKNADQKLPPASITKVMTMLLAVEALDKGSLKLTDLVNTSEHAASMGGSQIFLEPGERMTVEDMLKAMAVASANDASVAMAEHLSGSEAAFVAKMNARAAQLGCKNTHFVNPNGLPVEGHYSSARDIAIISRELLRHPLITRFTGIYEDHLRKGSDKPFWLVNTNKLVRFYSGMDGLKTGFTGEARYCLAATAKRGGTRFIAVVMGEPTSKVRNAEISQLLDYAFAQYETKVLYQPGQVVRTIDVKKGKDPRLDVTVGSTVGYLARRGEATVGAEQQVQLDPVVAPIQKGQRVGMIKLIRGGTPVSEVPLIASKSVERAGWLHMLGRTFKSWVSFGK